MPWTVKSPLSRTSSGIKEKKGHYIFLLTQNSSQLFNYCPALQQIYLEPLWSLIYLLFFRRGDIPFTVRRVVSRAGIESDEEAEAKSEPSEPKPEWSATVPLDSFRTAS